MTTAYDVRALAERFAPTFVIFPEDRAKVPYDADRILGPDEYGDYHPRAVDIVLDGFRLYAGGRPFQDPRGARPGRPAAHETERAWLKDLIARSVDLESTALNLTGVEADRPGTAWDQFFALTGQAAADGSPRYPEVVYARAVRADAVSLPSSLPGGARFGAGDLALQYWLFYYYNDFRNRHEMDWELVTIILSPRDGDWAPAWAGVSAHFGGTRRRWAEVPTAPGNPDSLLVFVAAGSHAQYFEHDPEGYRTLVRSARRWPWLSRAVGWLLRLALVRKLADTMVDIVPPNEERFYCRPPVLPMPERPGREDPAWWWMSYEGLWGERPDTFIDLGGSDYSFLSKGPRGPWLQGGRWDNPFAWICRLAEGRPDVS